jgi:hypothetical protein
LNVLELLVWSLQESPLASLKLGNMALGRDGNLHLLQPLLIKNMLHQLFLDNPGLGEGSMSTLSQPHACSKPSASWSHLLLTECTWC